jgi:putative ATP-dependent endonuclease of OLD family
MRLSKLSIRNFRNFQSIDIPLSGNVVLLGQNRVGKSNLLFAIQLILDPTLPDSARQLKLTDLWDGGPADYSAPIEVHLELSDFATDMALTALLTDFRTAHDPTVAQLSYVFRKKSEIAGAPQSSADCEFLVFGGGDETRSLPSRVRRRIAIDLLDALRDAEGQLGNWRSSPLRPLLEDAVSGISRTDIDAVAAELDKATKTLETFPTIKTLEDELRAGIVHLSRKGARHRCSPEICADRPTSPV